MFICWLSELLVESSCGYVVIVSILIINNVDYARFHKLEQTYKIKTC